MKNLQKYWIFYSSSLARCGSGSVYRIRIQTTILIRIHPDPKHCGRYSTVGIGTYVSIARACGRCGVVAEPRPTKMTRLFSGRMAATANSLFLLKRIFKNTTFLAILSREDCSKIPNFETLY